LRGQGGAQPVRLPTWFLRESLPGDAHHGKTGTDEGGILLAVLLEAALVELVAVELDDEALAAPQCVDLEAGDDLVRLGGWAGRTWRRT
jgi:hypothetical protein